MRNRRGRRCQSCRLAVVVWAGACLVVAASAQEGAEQVIPATQRVHGAGPPTGERPQAVFPVVTQFSPVPSGPGWHGEEGALSRETLEATVDNIRAHGFTGIEWATGRPPEEEAIIREYAASVGMLFSHHTGALEGFGRDAPPEICVYSEGYAGAVRQRVEAALAPLADIPRLYNVFTYQDEPFHGGPASFGYNDEVRAEFARRYGYELPPDLDGIRDNPKVWMDVLTFRASYFPDGWRQVYKAIKSVSPNFRVTMTHDSHNTFGAGYSSHAVLAIEDVYAWGGDFADLFVFDIYPYMAGDFRFGEPSRVAKPRMSQAHYSFAHMRNLCRAYGREMGFWVGTYNPTWFSAWMGPELAAMHWSEREMSATAVANGADYLLTGYRIPVDAAHWESFGEGLRLIQKAGARLLDAPKLQARACMLFPRTQYIQLQEEYFNVGLSFELFLRAFGELDLLHEDRIKDGGLEGYDVLLLFDVKLLPDAVARQVRAFVERGGVCIADCVPALDELRRPTTAMEALFGVHGAATDRIVRTGHLEKFRTREPQWYLRPDNPPDESVYRTDSAVLAIADETYAEVTLVSPRPFAMTSGAGVELLSSTASGQPAWVERRVGQGRIAYTGFCK